MTYDSRTRDRYRYAVTGLTGVVGVGALTLTGGLMGLASAQQAESEADQEPPAIPTVTVVPDPPSAAVAGAAKPRVRERPYVTRVTTRYVTAAGSGGAAPASGGGISNAPSQPVRTPEPPPPPDPPAPSSGS